MLITNRIGAAAASRAGNRDAVEAVVGVSIRTTLSTGNR